MLPRPGLGLLAPLPPTLPPPSVRPSPTELRPELVLPGDTVGAFCQRHEMGRRDLFRLNKRLRGRLEITSDNLLTAELLEGEQLNVLVTRSIDRLRQAAAQGRAVPAQDVDEMMFSELSGQHPILGVMQDAFNAGEKPESFMPTLSPGGLAAVAVVCAVIGGLLGKTKYGLILGPFMSGCCTLLGKIIPVESGEKPVPPSDNITPPACPADQIFFPEYAACGPTTTYEPCLHDQGFLSIEGVCVACPQGQRYNKTTRSCEEGCPEDRVLVQGVGCVLPNFGQRCTLPDGSKGVVLADGIECTLDGCPDGQIFDFQTNNCRPEGGEPANPGADKPATNTETKGMSTAAKVGIAFLGAAVIGGTVFALTRPSEDESGVSKKSRLAFRPMIETWTWGTRNILTSDRKIDVEAATQSWVELMEFFTNGTQGYQMGEDVFEYISEHRQQQSEAWRRQQFAAGKKPDGPYSGCTDLAQAGLVCMLGGDIHQLSPAQEQFARKVINRGEAWGWIPQVAVSRLRYGTGSRFKVLNRGQVWAPPPVSICIIGENGQEHVLVPKEVTDNQMVSYDYGQFWSRKPGQEPANYGGCERTRKLERRSDGRVYAGEGAGARPILGYVDVLGWLQDVVDRSPTSTDPFLARVP